MKEISAAPYHDSHGDFRCWVTGSSPNGTTERGFYGQRFMNGFPCLLSSGRWYCTCIGSRVYKSQGSLLATADDLIREENRTIATSNHRNCRKKQRVFGSINLYVWQHWLCLLWASQILGFQQTPTPYEVYHVQILTGHGRCSKETHKHLVF
ncbi:uncharacterized protein LOC129767671 isoform X1 [Toxorhynchites rutilus septentrionalis]|uniref:uncharacterized protein LOC129767671 isoform X1 n=1 Tax=Toxorhynchites rutilus septentrionalis TaxID=329112 RepID=UPI002479A32C|nr:uncharacterized protein LOC129767671 isoform X1 [Toxorhynchites rutilus septentrionalis]